MRLCIITNILTPYRVALFANMAQRCDDFTVLLMAEQEENRQWRIGPVPFKTEILPGRHIRPPGAEVSLHFNYGVVRRLRRLDPDVVLSGGFALAQLAAFTYCKLFGKRYVQWGEFTLRDGAQSSFVRRVLRQTMIRGANGCIASSTEAREAFLHYGADSRSILTALMPIEVDRIHADVTAIKGTPEYADSRRSYPGPVLLSVGRLLDAKGCRQLFELYARVQAVRPDVSLVIVGDGPARPAYESLCHDRAWQRVQFVGHIEPALLSRYLALGDLFVFPTLSDTFGAVLSEAMAAELPVLASVHAAASHDLVRDGINGWRFDPRDIAGGVARVLEFLELPLRDRQAMGSAAYEAVSRTDIEPSTEIMAEFLRSLPDSQSPKPSVLIIGPTPPPYHGVAMAIKTLLGSRLNQDFKLHHLDLADRRGIEHVNKPDLHDVALFIRQWCRLLVLLFRNRPQVMYFVLSQSTVGIIRDSLFVWPARCFGAKVVAHLHGGALINWYRRQWPFMRVYTRLLAGSLSRAVVLGESLRGQFEGLVPSDRIAVVPNGIEDVGVQDHCVSKPERRWRVLYLNTLNKMKGTLVLLDAVALVLDRRSDVEFIFAGPWSHDEHRKEAEAVIASRSLSHATTFTGQVSGDRKATLLHEADMFVFPGIQQEGQPLVVLEAMAAGLPIVFTNRGCLAETLRDGHDGLEVPVGDAVVLAERIQWLLDRPDEMQRLGTNARHRFEQEYTSQRHEARMSAILSMVASPAGTLQAPILARPSERDA